MSTYTNVDSYVNGYKVVKVEDDKIALEDNVIVDKRECTFVSQDPLTGATYYRADESALRYALEYKERTVGGLVAVVPDGADPDSILAGVVERAAKKQGWCRCGHELSVHPPDPKKPFAWPCRVSMCPCEEYTEDK